jgi:hypothetical protein
MNGKTSPETPTGPTSMARPGLAPCHFKRPAQNTDSHRAEMPVTGQSGSGSACPPARRLSVTATGNLRTSAGQTVGRLAVHDWDSVFAQRETAIVGLASAVWPAAGAPGEARRNTR